MIFYLIPFIFLTILTFLEYSKRFDFLIKNKYFYYLITIFFIIFIGLRYEIGCDWNQYLEMYKKYNSLSFIEIIKTNIFSEQKFEELGHIFLSLISQNIYITNLIYSIIFSIPLFYFCYQLKNKYFSILISYPYFIGVIGMGPMRQAASVSLLFFLILLISNRKYYTYILFTLISLLIHQSSILFNGLILGSLLSEVKKFKFSKINIFLLILISLFFLNTLPSIISKILFYIQQYKQVILFNRDPEKIGTLVVSPAKSAIFIWIINLIPSLIFLINRNKLTLNNNLKNIFTTSSILEILVLPVVLLNSVIGYRLLLYFFPSSIYITSQIPDLNLLNIKKEYIINFIIFIAFISLIIWLKFAFHSSCWIPYKNILFYI